MGAGGTRQAVPSLLLKADRKLERPPAVDLFGSMLGSEHDTAELLDQLIVSAGADPISEFCKHMSFHGRHDSGQLLAPVTGPGRENTSTTNRSF